MIDDIDWQVLYDTLSSQYQKLNETLVDCQRQLEKIETDVHEKVNIGLLRKFCEFADNFFHFEKSLGNLDVSNGVREGLRLIIQSFFDLLKSLKVDVVDCSPGTKFDPHFQEAVSTVSSQQIPRDCIVEELRKGYVYDRKLLRAARVVVSSGTAPA